jgi:dolichyl-phosphate beta-glucosyltransferase
VAQAEPPLSIVIPAYNESGRLPATLDAALATLASRGPEGPLGEIIVVDDGSTDSTADLVAAYAASHPVVRLLRNETNRGKGYSVRRGMLEARGRFVLFTDADASAPLPEASKLLAVLETGAADVAIGSRELPDSDLARPQPRHRRVMGWLFRQLVRLLVVRGFRDTQCGLKAFTREAAQAIFRRQTLDGFAFDVEAIFLARRLGYRVAEVPVRWLDSGESRVRPLRDGLRMVCDLVRIRLRARRADPERCPTGEDGI